MDSEYYTKTKQLADFFPSDDQTTLQIPHYQRGYSWKKKQVDDFLHDLYEHIDEPDEYYLGMITTISLESEKKVKRHELIDGQQRLTTAIILLACIRDKFYELGQRVGQIEKEIFNASAKGKNEYYKIILDDDDNSFFSKCILDRASEPGADKFKNVPIEYKTQKKLRDAYNIIQKKIEESLYNKSDEEQFEFLDKLRNTLRDNFHICNLQISDSDKAYNLFERMNDRGLPLAPSDLAKDLILHLIHKEHKENGKEAAKKAAKDWSDLESRLLKNKLKINNYIHHYLVTFHSRVNKRGEIRYVQKTKVFRGLKDILGINEKSRDTSRKLTGTSFLNDLHVRFNDYEALVSCVLPSNKKDIPKPIRHNNISLDARYNISWINELRILIVYPVLMAGLEKYNKNDFEKLTDILLKWFFRVKTLEGEKPTKLEKYLATIAYGIRNDEAPEGNLTILDVKKELKKLDISPDRFADHLSESSLGTTLSKYFLAKIAESEDSKKVRDLMFPTTLEHIMPNEGIERSHRLENGQKSNWLDYIKKVNNKSDDDARLFHKNYRNKLGNLTLVDPGKNPCLGVNSFDEKCGRFKNKKSKNKCKTYKDSGIEITRKIIDDEQWDEDAIKSRQDYLIKIAKEIWEI